MTNQDQQESLQNFNKYYNSLNPEQKKAVDTIEGPVMTIAGAGTGKTQILAVRIAKILLETQISPSNILCLTFTETGVTAMRHRLQEIIGPSASHIKITTFHSFCNEVIKDHLFEFNLSSDHLQVSDIEKIEILKEAIDSLGYKSEIRPLGEPYHHFQNIIQGIQNLKKENINPAKFQELLQEIKSFTDIFNPLIEELCNAQRKVPDECLNAVNPQNIKSNFPTPTHIQQNYLNYYQKLWDNFQSQNAESKKEINKSRLNFRDQIRIFKKSLTNKLPHQFELAKAYQKYQELMAKKKRYDYEDMIMLVSQRFQKDSLNPQGGMLRDYQELYQYILVDEYQDTNSAQNLTVSLIGNFFNNPNIFVVGDDDQSIYRFQGASVENIIDFHHQYQEYLKIITLNRNYRSQQTILDSASELIKNNTLRIASHIPSIDKNLKSQVEIKESPIKINIYSSEDKESYYTAKKVQKLINQGVDPNQIAILYRKHSNSNLLIEYFKKLNIPHHIIAGVNILDDFNIEKLIQLFQLINDCNNDEYLAHGLFLNFFGLPRLDVFKITQYYNQKNRFNNFSKSLFQTISSEEALKEAEVKNPQIFLDLAEKLAQWKSDSENKTLNKFFEIVIRDSGFLNNLIKEKDRLSQLNKINTLFKELKKENQINHKLTINQFLEQLKIRQEFNFKLYEDPLVGDKSGVQLMTVHASKGLEFEYVFMINCAENHWEKSREMNTLKLPPGLIASEIKDELQEKEEDNRRLFYVGMTRAKKELFVSYPTAKSDQNKSRNINPSRFIKELNESYIEINQQETNTEEEINELETLLFFEEDYDFTEQEKAFIKGLVSKIVLSPTAVNTYLQCPRKFFFQNVLRIPSAKNVSASMGTAIHKALEVYFTQYHTTHTKPPKELLTLTYKSALTREILNDEDYQIRLNYGLEILNDYYEKNKDKFHPNIISEYNFSRDGVNIDGVPITGKIDKIEDLDQGLIITDYKTGKPKYALKKSKRPSQKSESDESKNVDYWRQLVFYKLLADNSPNFQKKFKNKKVLKSTIDLLEKDKEKKDYLKNPELEITPADEKEVIENIKFVYQQMNLLNFEVNEHTSPTDKCPFHDTEW